MKRLETITSIATLLAIAALLIAGLPALADETEDATDNAAEAAVDEGADAQPPVKRGDGIDSPKEMSGMSILGNEEAPKALVIIPWKSSEMGDDISLSDTLDDRAKPVDKEVFLRELRFYEIRSGGE